MACLCNILNTRATKCITFQIKGGLRCSSATAVQSFSTEIVVEALCMAVYGCDVDTPCPSNSSLDNLNYVRTYIHTHAFCTRPRAPGAAPPAPLRCLKLRIYPSSTASRAAGCGPQWPTTHPSLQYPYHLESTAPVVCRLHPLQQPSQNRLLSIVCSRTRCDAVEGAVIVHLQGTMEESSVGWLVAWGFVCVSAGSFFHPVAPPFHSFVTTCQ